MTGQFMTSGRAWVFSAILFSLFSCLGGDPAAAGTYEVTVEPGGVVTVDVLDKDKAPPAAVLVSVGTAAHGNASITPDKRSVSFRSVGDYVGADSFTYEGKDPTTNQAYSGRVQVSVVAPQRIVGLDYQRVAGVLGIVLVLAIVLEIALATVFNWKYFQEKLENKGLRTPIAVAVSGFFTYFYGLDVVSDLLSAFTAKGAPFEKTLPGYVVTAFIVAGGSGTVNRLFAALGLRPPVQDSSPESRQQAKLVVNFTRGANIGAATPITVSIDDQMVLTATGNRFPAVGSYTLSPGAHTIRLNAIGNGGQALTQQQQVNLAPSADVSIGMTIGAA